MSDGGGVRDADARPTGGSRGPRTSTRWPRTASRTWRRSSSRPCARGLDVIAITDHERIDAAVAARSMAEARRPAASRSSSGEEITTRSGHLVGLFLRRAHPALAVAHARASRRSTTRAASRSSPIRSCPTRCARAPRTIRRLLDAADPVDHPDALEAFNPTTARLRWSRRVPAFAEEVGLAAVAALRRPSGDRGRARVHDVRGARPPRTCARRSRRATPAGAARPTRGASSSGCSGAQLERYARAPVTSCGASCAATAAVATSATRAAGRGRRASIRVGRPAWPRSEPMKIGLVTPYIFPVPGGVNAHVGYLYENLVQRGHDVRIISSTHGPQRSSEGDIIRLGYGWSVPTNGSIGTLTVSHRYGQLVERDARPRAVRHPPLPRAVRAVPVAADAAPLDERQRRHVPRLLGLQPLVRVRQAHAPALREAAPRPHRGQRGGTPLHQPLLPGRVQGHPQRRRPAPVSATRRPSRAGATASRTSSSSAASRAARASCTCCAPTTSCACEGLACRLLLVGARPAGGARRVATSPRASSAASRCSGASPTATRRAPSRPPTSSPRPRPARSRSASCSSRRWPRACPSSAATSTATRASCAATSRPCSCRRATPRRLAAALGTAAARPGPARAHGRVRPRAGRAVQLGEHHRQGRGLLRLRHPAPGGERQPAARLHRPDPRRAAPPAGDARPLDEQPAVVPIGRPTGDGSPLGERASSTGWERPAPE